MTQGPALKTLASEDLTNKVCVVIGTRSEGMVLATSD